MARMRQRWVIRLGPVLLVVLLALLGSPSAGQAGAPPPDDRHPGGPVVGVAVPPGGEVLGSVRPGQPVSARPVRLGLLPFTSNGLPLGVLRLGWWPVPQWTGLIRAAAGVAASRGRAPPGRM